jgi:hypothetical protein
MLYSLGSAVLQLPPVLVMHALIDEFCAADGLSARGTRWAASSDKVMGGVSQAQMRRLTHAGQACIELSGAVSLENNGGFVQLALDLDADGQNTDARAYRGLRMLISGNGEPYGVHLRTTALARPWQSYRAQFEANESWAQVLLPFASFVPHRVDAPLDLSMLRRIGFVAIGRAFDAQLRIARLEFYT